MNTTHVIVVEIPKPLWKNDNGSHGNWYAHNRLMQTLKRLGWAEAADWRNRHDGVSFEHCRLDVYVQYPPNGRSRADPSNADNVANPSSTASPKRAYGRTTTGGTWKAPSTG